MATFKIKTKNELDINKKPRVYFTCHPEDFDKYFEKICEDIFKTHDCAIYYTEDMTEVIADDEKETDLGRMNLFVVPVTFKLLSKPNRAMDEDIAYAKNENIPILPIMVESGIDVVYSKPDKFGEMQYLNPYSRDLTEISYEEKLGKYLVAVLISDEMEERVRAAFDAYIFLSYRKKDRKYANQLMRIIHSNPQCRDIAIWFDEFLTPGESFRENINKILQNSQLFTLLVTPNLLEEPDGKPNFVMGEEYPAAYKSGIKILPAEMEETDKALLADKYEGIPECSRVDEDNFNEQFIEAISRVATEENNTPEHDFLIGLAYLDGIDVEVNRELGIELITEAAESGLIEAMYTLDLMYSEGVDVDINYNEALKWREKIYVLYHDNFGEEHPDTLTSLSNLAYSYGKVGDYEKSLELTEKVYILQCKILGEEHPNTLTSLNNLASGYGKVGDYKKSLELTEKAYILKCKILGEEHPDTLISLNNLACSYREVGDYEKSLELMERVYTLHRKILGEEHPDTLGTLNNLAYSYGEVGNDEKSLELMEKSLELMEKVYTLYCKIFGEEYPDTLITLNNLAVGYVKIGDYEKSLKLFKKAYILKCKILGEEHPDTLGTLNNLAYSYGEVGNHTKKLELVERVYTLYRRTLGEDHPDTLLALSNLGCSYADVGDYEKSLELMERAYILKCKTLGEEYPDTLLDLSGWATICVEAKYYSQALICFEKVYFLYVKKYGEKSAKALEIAEILAWLYDLVGES